MTKINGSVLTIPGFTVGLQQDTAIAPLGSFVSASNLVPLLGSRMGIRGGSRIVQTLHNDLSASTAVYGDTFVGSGGDGQALPAHTPTGSPNSFGWVTGTFATCLDWGINQTTSPTNQALLPLSGWPGGGQSLRESIMTGSLTVKAACDVMTHAMASEFVEFSGTLTIPSGLTLDHYSGLAIGCNANGGGGFLVSVGFVNGRQRFSVWSRDAVGVLQLIEQYAPTGPDIYTNDVPFTFGIRYTQTGGLQYYLGGWGSTVQQPSSVNVGYCAVWGARSEDGDITDYPRFDSV